MGFDCLSGYTKGKCWRCKVVWYWKQGKRRLKDTPCPECGARLRATTHQMKRFPWKPLPTPLPAKFIAKHVGKIRDQGNLPASVAFAVAGIKEAEEMKGEI